MAAYERFRHKSATEWLVGLWDMHYTAGTRAAQLLQQDITTLRGLSPSPAGLILGGDQVNADYLTTEQAIAQMTDVQQIVATLGVPYHAMVGNHDLLWAEAARRGDASYALSAFHAVFGPEYYSFDEAGIHFVVLNCFDINVNGTDEKTILLGRFPDVDKAFLARDLARLPVGQPVVLMTHGPPWFGQNPETTTSWGQDREAWRILARYNVVACLVGHGHQFIGRGVRNPVNGAFLPCMMSGATDGAKWITRLNRDFTPRGWLNLFLDHGVVTPWYGAAEATAVIQIESPTLGQEFANKLAVRARCESDLPVASAWAAVDDDRSFNLNRLGVLTQRYGTVLDLAPLAAGTHRLTVGVLDTAGRSYESTIAFGVAARPRIMLLDQAAQTPAGVDGWDVAAGDWQRAGDWLVGQPSAENLEPTGLLTAGAPDTTNYRVTATLRLDGGSGGLAAAWSMAHEPMYELAFDPAAQTISLLYRKSITHLYVLGTKRVPLAYGKELRAALCFDEAGHVQGILNGKIELNSRVEDGQLSALDKRTRQLVLLDPLLNGRLGLMVEDGGQISARNIMQTRWVAPVASPDPPSPATEEPAE